MDEQNENINVEENIVNENVGEMAVDEAVNENVGEKIVDENVSENVDKNVVDGGCNEPYADNELAGNGGSSVGEVATKIIAGENSGDCDVEGGPLDGDLAQLYEHFRLVVDTEEPVRVDKYMTEHLQHASRSRIQRAAAAGYVFVNGKTVRNNYNVKQGDIITLMLSRPHYDKSIVIEDIPINIVYEDDDLVVVNKTAGMVVHPGIGNYTGTLVNALAYHFSINDPAFDPLDPCVGIVHRIDKDTSGLLVVAKNDEAREKLAAQFFNKTTLRSYNALVWGHFDSNEGRIEGNISRDPKDRQRMTVTEPDSGIGKPAVTHWRTIECFGYVTLVECVLETGRTHQIRAHMKHIGHPLFADDRYGGMEILRGENSASYKAFIANCFKICPRQALHARTLGFVHPTTGEEMNFSADLPDDFSQLLDKWRTYIAGKIN